ncbi:hypothetical protein QC590_15015 [Pseudomonas putida]|uniref:hypothetical protein n=1 Tax=Pseudomonas putida TaxID=303 RepID=UPI0033617195
MNSDSLPLFERGFGRVKLALKSTLKRAPRSSPAWLGEQPAWRDELLCQGCNVSGTRILDQLGNARSLGLHWALQRPAARQYARIGIEPITFEELHNTGA